MHKRKKKKAAAKEEEKEGKEEAEKRKKKKETREADLIANEYSLYLLLPFLHSEQKRSRETDDKE